MIKHESTSGPVRLRTALAETAGEPVTVSVRVWADGALALRAAGGPDLLFRDLAQAACLAHHVIDAIDEATALLNRGQS